MNPSLRGLGKVRNMRVLADEGILRTPMIFDNVNLARVERFTRSHVRPVFNCRNPGQAPILSKQGLEGLDVFFDVPIGSRRGNKSVGCNAY